MQSASYPCYKNLDPFIDLERLRALDDFIVGKIEQRLAAAADLQFYTGPFLLEQSQPKRPGSRMVYLTEAMGEDDYYRLDDPGFWRPSKDAQEFGPLMDFIATLPFAATGRMLIMYDPAGGAVSAHRDHDSGDLCHEFIWFRTNLDKPFYMLDERGGEKLYVTSHSAWFDTVNQFHGADANGRLSISIRVDGKFTDEFRNQIPYPTTGRSAAAALWASAER